MSKLLQRLRFITRHDLYNAGELASFPRDEAERLIAIQAAVPDTGAPKPDTEQTFIPQKELDKQAKAAGQRPRAGGAYPDERPGSFPIPKEDPRSPESGKARDEVADKYEDGGDDKAYEAAKALGLTDPVREHAARQPPAVHVHLHPEATKVDSAKANKQVKGSKTKKAKGPGASARGAAAAGQGTGTGPQDGGKAQNIARDTRTEDRNRGAPLGPASPKESNRGPSR